MHISAGLEHLFHSGHLCAGQPDQTWIAGLTRIIKRLCGFNIDCSIRVFRFTHLKSQELLIIYATRALAT